MSSREVLGKGKPHTCLGLIWGELHKRGLVPKSFPSSFFFFPGFWKFMTFVYFLTIWRSLFILPEEVCLNFFFQFLPSSHALVFPVADAFQGLGLHLGLQWTIHSSSGMASHIHTGSVPGGIRLHQAAGKWTFITTLPDSCLVSTFLWKGAQVPLTFCRERIEAWKVLCVCAWVF